MKRLQLLAISDTHLGEDTSLLSFPHGRQHLWKVLRQTFGTYDPANPDASRGFEVEQMILMGDIPDRTLSSTSEIITHTNAFIQMLGSAARIKRGVYVPGNHDHTMWRDYCRRRYGRDYGITAPEGELLVKDGARCDRNRSGEDYLGLLFGYPDGSGWRAIASHPQPGSFSFSVANPVYVTEVHGRTYVFAHGTHFRALDVAGSVTLNRILDHLQADRLFGHLEIDSSGDVRKAKDLRQLEEIARRLADTLWPSCENVTVTQSDQLWYLLTAISGRFGHQRRTPGGSKLFSRRALAKARPSRIAHLTSGGQPAHRSVELWQELFLPHLLKYLQANKRSCDPLTFVYGDTHGGGWGEVARSSGSPIRLYNTGGWTIDNPDNHPPCHLFAVDDQGQEYLLDVSFRDVMVGHDRLRDLAATPAEHRFQNTSRLLRLVLDGLT